MLLRRFLGAVAVGRPAGRLVRYRVRGFDCIDRFGTVFGLLPRRTPSFHLVVWVLLRLEKMFEGDVVTRLGFREQRTGAGRYLELDFEV